MRYLICVLLLLIPAIAFGMFGGQTHKTLTGEKDEALQKHFLSPVMWALKNGKYPQFKEFINRGYEFPVDQLVGLLTLDGFTVANHIPMLFTRCPIKKDSIKTYNVPPLKELLCRFFLKHNPSVIFTDKKIPAEVREHFIQVLPACRDQSKFKVLAQIMKNQIDQYPMQVHQAGIQMTMNYKIPSGIALLQQMAATLTSNEKNQVFDALRYNDIQLNNFQQLLYSMAHFVVNKQTQLAEQYKKELKAINPGALDIFKLNMARASFKLCFRNTDAELQPIDDIVFENPEHVRLNCLEDIIQDLNR